MPRVKLEISSLIDLPQPPKVVDEALWHWKEYLRFLPAAGPRKQTTCAGIEKTYALHVTKKLQCQYPPAEPDERQMYDWKLGEEMDKVFMPALSKRQRLVVKAIHVLHMPIELQLRKFFYMHREEDREGRFHLEIEAAYDILLGKLCRR